jgi:peptidyl-dipeptidase A
VAFLPFGLLVDKWRWEAFSGAITPAQYNDRWWQLRREYQGVMSAVPRSAADFDPGAKYHVPANTPYLRYFLATIIQFQLHRALCEKAGWTGPLNECSIHGNQAAGEALWKMLQLGASKPWPDALEEVTGSRQLDATAILEYFGPLHAWLKKENKGQTCGW